MRARELLNEKYLYHVTFTDKVDNILDKGLLQLQPSNWSKGDGSTRYNEEAGLFAFENPEDATNWANKMQYEFDRQDVSIVRINPSDVWYQDPSSDINLRMGKGRSMRSQHNIGATDIIDVFDVSKFGNPMTREMSRDEWLADVAKILET